MNMKLTKKEQEICNRYSARDSNGFVHCNECPLVFDTLLCKSNCDETEWDEYVNETEWLEKLNS